jgi:phospholipid-binding lipoprotein MlaA
MLQGKYMLPRLLIFVLMLPLLGGCATNATPTNPNDPWESTNRRVYEFNDALDRKVVKPAADGYTWVTPRFVRRGVTNFFDNVSYPKVIVNSFLQGKGRQGLVDSSRFLVNTTLGVVGLFDVATPLGLPASNEDFGLTFAAWGANSGPYLVLPGYGPSTVRDSLDVPGSVLTNPLTWLLAWNVTIPLTALYAVNTRAELDQAVRIRDEAALEPYSFVRAAYLQYRQNLMHEGAGGMDVYDDDDLFDDAFGD